MIFEMIIEIEENLTDYCIECGGSIIYIPEIGEAVCNQCGLVIYERGLDLTHSDKRIYGEQEHMSREQNGSLITPLTPSIGLHTVLPIEEITNPDLKRAAKWNTRISWNEKNILIATTELRRISSNLYLPDYVKVSAIKIYKRIHKMNSLKGRSIIAMVAACIYYACRKLRVNRMFKEILEETSCSEKNIRRCFQVLLNELNLKVPVIDFHSLIPKYTLKLKLDTSVVNLVIMLLESNKESMFLMGKDPKGVCAGALYLICKLKNIKMNQKRIAEVVGVSIVTIRSRYKEFLKNLNPGLKDQISCNHPPSLAQRSGGQDKIFA